MQHMRHDAAMMRDAYLKGTADFKTDLRRFEKELSHETSRNMVFLLWVRTPDRVKEMVKKNDPEGYKWITEEVAKMQKERK